MDLDHDINSPWGESDNYDEFASLFASTRQLKRERLKHELAQEILRELEATIEEDDQHTETTAKDKITEFMRVSITEDVTNHNKKERDARFQKNKKIVQLDDLPKQTFEEFLGFDGPSTKEPIDDEFAGVSTKGRRLYDGATVEVYTFAERVERAMESVFSSLSSSFELWLMLFVAVFILAFRLGKIVGARTAANAAPRIFITSSESSGSPKTDQ